VLTGDVNMDGTVDFNDIQSILGYRFNNGQAADYTDGNLANHGIVNGDDIQFVLSANYNTGEHFPAAGPEQTAAGAAAGSTTTPFSVAAIVDTSPSKSTDLLSGSDPVLGKSKSLFA
jgi:hypothetical protein